MWTQHVLSEHWHFLWIPKAGRDFYPRNWFSPPPLPPNLFLANLSKRSFHSPGYSSQQPGYHDSPLSWVPPLPNPSLSPIKHTSKFYLQSSWLLHSSLPPTSPYLDYCPLVAPSFHCAPFDYSPQRPEDRSHYSSDEKLPLVPLKLRISARLNTPRTIHKVLPKPVPEYLSPSSPATLNVKASSMPCKCRCFA